MKKYYVKKLVLKKGIKKGLEKIKKITCIALCLVSMFALLGYIGRNDDEALESCLKNEVNNYDYCIKNAI